MGPDRPRARRRRRPPRRGAGPGPGAAARVLGVIAILGAIAAGAALLLGSDADAKDDRRAAARQFAAAWARGDLPAMWRTLSPSAQEAHSQRSFVAAYGRTNRGAGVRTVRIGRPAEERDGRIEAAVAVRTRDFPVLRGTIALPVSGAGGDAGVDWSPTLRLPGLRRGERVRARAGRRPRRASILAADGRPLDATPLGASIAGDAGGKRPTGLQRIYDDRLVGRPARRLLFGRRVVARARATRGRTLRTTIRPGLMARAAAALGDANGGVAVIRPRDGSVLALAGLAVSAPQPPGSTFKIVTLAAALKHGVAKPSSSYPVRTSATLSGVTLRNASGESCGGSLTESFTESCNSVFAPLGAKLGARRLVAVAEDFGFNEKPRIPAAEASTISRPAGLRDAIAVGSAAIGQERDLATPLQMASVGATIARDGRRIRPRIATIDPIVARRVVSARVAHQVRAMMLNVVRSGTGTSAAISGVEVAGKTGTAELRPNSTDPKDADAWFVAFAPARRPKVAVAVMLIGAGFGGTTAAPIAKEVLQAALDRG